MKHAELEETLRATLGDRADTVTRGPDWRVPAPSRPGPRRHTARRLAPVAAAAAVAAVVVSVVAIEHRSGSRHTSPGTHQPSGTITNNSPTTTATTPAPTVPLACRATLPPEWRQAIHSSLVDVGGTTAMPMSVTPGGGILVARDFGPIPGSPRDVVLVARGRAPQVVFHVPDPDRYFPARADEYGRWLVVALRVLTRPEPGVVPGSASGNVVRIMVVDMRTGASRTIAGTSAHDATSGGRTITDSATVNGKVFWDERSKYISQTGQVKQYDLATGRTTVAYQGRLGRPVGSAAGFGLTQRPTERIEAPVPIPEAVARATDARMRATLATDGTSWAWIAGPHEIGWWSSNYAAGSRLVRLRGAALTGPDFYPNPPVVSGRFVFPSQGTGQVVDVLGGASAPTGAGAPIPDYRPHTRGSVAELSGPYGSLIGEVESGPAGHFVQGYWQDTPVHVLRLDTRGLPGLAC